MAYVITTVSGTLSLKKLGYRIPVVHPAVLDLSALGFTAAEIDNSEEIQDALLAGTITATNNGNAVTVGVSVTPAAPHSSTHTNGSDDIQTASGSQKGVISSTDWNTFNNKQAALGYTPVPNSRTVNGKALTADIILGLASSDFANQGTTSTVLHGNAGGNPSFGSVVDADIGAHTSTKITITAKGQLNSSLVYNDQANTFGSFNQIFPSERFQIRNPGNSFSYILQSSAITADRILTIPVVTQTEILAIRPQVYQATPANPTGTNSTTGVMMGLAGTITPRVTGRVLIIISGDAGVTTNVRSANIQIRYGTGGSPANGAALTGTTAGAKVQALVASTTNRLPFHVQAIVTGLTVGTAIWVDVSLNTITSGTANIKNVSITIFEL